MQTASKQLKIKRSVWKNLIAQLKQRGKGKQESGAFLLSSLGSDKVCEFICYDELDPNCMDHKIITFNGAGYVPLWDYCLKNGLRVIADVHTHPSGWVDQSPSDSNYPMIAQKGHIAMILPNYAVDDNLKLSDAGVFEYLGDKKWKEIKLNSKRVIEIDE